MTEEEPPPGVEEADEGSEEEIMILESASPEFPEEEVVEEGEEFDEELIEEVDEEEEPDWWLGKGVELEERRGRVIGHSRGWVYVVLFEALDEPRAVRKTKLQVIELTSEEKALLPPPEGGFKTGDLDPEIWPNLPSRKRRRVVESQARRPFGAVSDAQWAIELRGPLGARLPAERPKGITFDRNLQRWKATARTGKVVYLRNSDELPSHCTPNNQSSRAAAPPSRTPTTKPSNTRVVGVRGIVSDTQWRVERAKPGGHNLPADRPKGLAWNAHFLRWHAVASHDGTTRILKTVEQLVDFCFHSRHGSRSSKKR